MVVNNKTYVVDTMIMLILFTFICIGTIFATSDRFVDSQIMPKWLAMSLGIILLANYLIIRFLFFSHLKGTYKNKKAIYIIGTVVIVTFAQALYGIFQFFNLLPPTTAFRVTGSFDNPAGFAASLCAALPFYIWGITKSRSILRLTLIVITFSTILAIIFSESRSGILSVLVIAFCWSIRRIKTTLGRKIILLSLICLVVITGLYYIKKDSADGRLLIWRCAMPMLQQNWLTGYGTGGFEAHYMDYQADYFEKHPADSYSILADNVQYPFCEYLRIIIDYGIIGILLLLGWLSYLLFCYFKYPSEMNETSLLCWIAVCTFSCFSYPLMYPFVWLMLIYSTYILIRKHIKSIIRRFPYICLKGVAVSCILFSIYAGYKVYIRMQAEMQWAHITNLSLMGKTKEVLPKYEKLMKSLGNDRYFLYNYSAELFQAERYKESLAIAMECHRHWADYDVELLLGDLYEHLEQSRKAEQCYRRASYMCPSRFVPLYQLVMLLKKEKRLVEVNQIAYEIINKPEKIRSPIISLIKREMSNLTSREN
ncbi:MAG TPA: hypothetical protein DHV06_04890 [Bacteroides thetaiotaomicron]|nr:hypothetical protein [Bacteroides thetaiotaomicron]